jgi:hypothetical protein
MDGSMSRRWRAVPIAVLTVLAVVAAAPVAQSRPGGGGGDTTESGYEVSVRVTVTGDGAPGGGGTISVSMPPLCWWEPIPSDVWLGNPTVDATDPESVYDWYKIAYKAINGTFAPGRLVFPDEQVFLDAIAREEAGEDLTWYTIASESTDPIPCSPYVHDVSDDYGDQIAVMYAPFPAGSPPEPEVDPETLAIEAVDRNPKLTDAVADATFVNLPTWFWVTDPASVGGAAGQRSIRAEVVGSGVWAEVTARTGGLSVAYPGGSQQCEPERAMLAWAPDLADDAGCTLEFRKASVAYPEGYPVTASTQWSATWEGQDQDGASVGGELEPLSRSTTVQVPVAEVQTIVRGAR